MRAKQPRPAEALLWDYLDQCGIPFRQRQSVLITERETRNCGWTDNLNYCDMSGDVPFIPDLIHPLVFQFYPTGYHPAPPSTLQSYIRKYDSLHENFECAVNHLSALFGTGLDDSVSNTIGRRWTFGQAQIRALAFTDPSSRFNSRHSDVPGSQKECTVSLDPAYCFPLSPDEKMALQSYAAIDNMRLTEQMYLPLHVTEIMRLPSVESRRLKPGYGHDKSKRYLIHIRPSRYTHIIPSHWIEYIECTQLKPAKGGGASYMSVYYRALDKADVDAKFLCLASEEYSDEGFEVQANMLGDVFNVPVRMCEDVDI